MSRREQIEKQAREQYPPDWHQGIDDNLGWRMGFVFGAEWADKNPIEPILELIYQRSIAFDAAKLAQAQLAVALSALEREIPKIKLRCDNSAHKYSPWCGNCKLIDEDMEKIQSMKGGGE